MWPIVVWPGKLLADSYFFIFFIYFNKTYIKILCYNNHAHTSLNQSSENDEERKGIKQEYWEQEPPPLSSEVARAIYVRQQIAKRQVLMRSQQNCSKQKERQYWIECTEYVWRSGKLVSGQRNGHSPRSSHLPRNVILNNVQILEQLLLSRMQVRSFFGSYWKGSD